MEILFAIVHTLILRGQKLSIFSTIACVLSLVSPLQTSATVSTLQCSRVFIVSTENLLDVDRDLSAYENIYKNNWRKYPDTGLVFNHGVPNRADVYEAFYVPLFINTFNYRKASLHDPLAAIFKEQSPDWRFLKSPEPKKIKVRSKTYWDNKRDNYTDVFVWRGSGNEDLTPKEIHFSTNIPGHPYQSGQGKVFIESTIKKSLSQLYEDFGNQGPERKILVPIVREQDRRDLERTTHFEIGRFSGSTLAEEVGHLQVMTSSHQSEPLHLEEQWGSLSRQPGEVIAEIGRYYFSKINDQVGRLQISKDKKLQMRLKLWQKMFSWANHDVKIDRVFFQVNDIVRRVLISYGLPLTEAKARRVTQIIDGREVGEWIFEFDRSMMLLAEKRIMAKLISLDIKEFLLDNVTRDELEKSILVLKFSRNEIRSLVNLGIVEVVQDSDPRAHKHLSYGRPGDPGANSKVHLLSTGLKYNDKEDSFSRVKNENDTPHFYITQKDLMYVRELNLSMTKNAVEKLSQQLAVFKAYLGARAQDASLRHIL